MPRKIKWITLNVKLLSNEEDEEAGKGFDSDEQRRAFFGLMKRSGSSPAKKKVEAKDTIEKGKKETGKMGAVEEAALKRSLHVLWKQYAAARTGGNKKRLTEVEEKVKRDLREAEEKLPGSTASFPYRNELMK